MGHQLQERTMERHHSNYGYDSKFGQENKRSLNSELKQDLS